MMGDYKIPSLTTDIFIFDENTDFILIKRKNDPFKNHWALPGGFVEYGETVETAAIREAKEETNIDVELLDLVNVYSKPYIAKGNMDNKKADSDACEIGIFSQKDLVNIELAFDHAKIINDCLNVVSSKF